MYLEKLKQIDTFIFDVDGVYTDGKILLSESGDLLRAMDIKDGYATKKAIQSGLKIIIISGGKSESVRTRFERLGVADVYLGIEDKVQIIEQLVSENKIDLSKTAYMGDDMPDLAPMKLVSYKCCPSDAVMEIKEISDYISPIKGGEGCVRDILEKTLKLQGLWG